MDNKIKEYVKSICHLKTERLKAKKIYNFIMEQDNANASKAKYLSQTKKYLESINYFKNKKLYYKIGNTELYNELKEKQAIKRESYEVETYNYKIIEEINKFKTMDNVYKQYAYLLLQSGLRLNELYKNNISYLDEYKINITKISKKKYNDNKKIYEVNLLIPAKEFIEIYDKIQKDIIDKEITLESIKKTSIYHLNKIDERLNNHLLRKMYIYIQLHYNKFKDNLMPSQRVKLLLNHSGENISVFYNDTIRIEK